MSATAPALFAAAAGVGFGHGILPHHWVPLAVLGQIRGRWRERSAGALTATVLVVTGVLVLIGAI